jgi:hypothetical protein
MDSQSNLESPAPRSALLSNENHDTTFKDNLRVDTQWLLTGERIRSTQGHPIRRLKAPAMQFVPFIQRDPLPSRREEGHTRPELS